MRIHVALLLVLVLLLFRVVVTVTVRLVVVIGRGRRNVRRAVRRQPRGHGSLVGCPCSPFSRVPCCTSSVPFSCPTVALSPPCLVLHDADGHAVVAEGHSCLVGVVEVIVLRQTVQVAPLGTLLSVQVRDQDGVGTEAMDCVAGPGQLRQPLFGCTSAVPEAVDKVDAVDVVAPCHSLE